MKMAAGVNNIKKDGGKTQLKMAACVNNKKWMDPKWRQVCV